MCFAAGQTVMSHGHTDISTLTGHWFRRRVNRRSQSRTEKGFVWLGFLKSFVSFFEGICFIFSLIRSMLATLFCL